MNKQGARPRVVVIGAGFGGLNAVHALAKLPVEVVLIDRNNYHLFQPLLYQVATAALSPADIAAPIRTIFAPYSNIEVLLGGVQAIDIQNRLISVGGIGTVGYDQLIIASGAVPSWFGNDDWAKHSTSLKSLQDAEALRQRLLGAFEWAESRKDPSEISRLLTFVIVGGGPSGVELAGAISDLARYTLPRDFRRIRHEKARIVLFEGGPTVLAGFPDKLTTYARKRLESMGVEVHTGVQVDQVDADGVVAGDQRVAAANVFWCAGVAASPAAKWLSTEAGGPKTGKHGTLEVQPDCSLPGHPEIFAIGDVASFKDDNGHPLPGVAPVAKQQGHYVANVIGARVAGRKLPGPFRYSDEGGLAVVGRSAAVANLPHLKLTGLSAFSLWGCVHLFLLVGLRNRVLVYIQWISVWLFHARSARLIDHKTTNLTQPKQREHPQQAAS